FEAITRILLLLGTLYILEAIFRYAQSYLTGVLAQRTVYDMRKDLKEKLGQLPIEYFDTNSVGDVMSCAVNDMEQIANTLQRSLARFILAVVTCVAVLIAMLMVGVKMSLMLFASFGRSPLFSSLIATRSCTQ